MTFQNALNTYSGGFTLQSSGGSVDIHGLSTTSSGPSVTAGPLGTGTITLGSSANGAYGTLLNSSPTAGTLANSRSISSTTPISLASPA